MFPSAFLYFDVPFSVPNLIEFRLQIMKNYLLKLKNRDW